MSTETVQRNEARFDCQECGMNVAPAEYHPYRFCVLFKSGIDPHKIDPADPILDDVANG